MNCVRQGSRHKAAVSFAFEMASGRAVLTGLRIEAEKCKAALFFCGRITGAMVSERNLIEKMCHIICTI